MKIGIDIDNTITETSLLANTLVKNDKRYSENNDYHNLNEAKLKDFLNTYLGKIVYNVKLKDNVIKVLNKWHNLGYKLIFITARGVEKTDNFINLNTLHLTSMYFTKMKIPFDEIVFFKDSKAATAIEYNLDLFIDDKEKVLDEISCAGIKTLRITTSSESKHKVVRNWLEIENIVTETGDK